MSQQSQQNNQNSHSRIVLAYRTKMMHKDKSKNYKLIQGGASIITTRNYNGITTQKTRNYRLISAKW